ncbi:MULTISPECIES: D-alanyl-D-alanine carboxypeptidase family protein [unclassified Streptomyces]|uniref:D-alanyl-D-alanine carboxypeptidase family protein n=1 Tax=unclassified Streptomyces TaxID=2593676 RepID=UPI0004C7D021|nr:MULTISPECIES: D-alanyl-D-alanine carboxypeptidase family protein [unclassified Streptomyces]
MPASHAKNGRRRAPVAAVALLSLPALPFAVPGTAFAAPMPPSPGASASTDAAHTPGAGASASTSASSSAGASADPSSGATAAGSASATPPATMSAVGGARLGLPGTQAELGSGAPVLPKDITARSWIVADAESGDVLAAHNAHWKLPPASTQKMLFADTLLPKLLPRTTEHKVTASDLAGMGAGSSVVPLHKGQTYSVRDLWLGVFLKSGNDAVHVLSAMNGGIDATVDDMQAHAKKLRALDTTVVDPDGYDAPKQVSSAYDLTLIARSGLQKKDFREYCSTVTATLPGAPAKSGGKRTSGTIEIRNTNRLLAGDTDVTPYPGLAGVKNGNTTKAGATFTGVAERGGRVLLVTVMNPENGAHNEVYKEAAKLLDWGFSAAGKATPVGELVAPVGAESEGSGSGTPTAAPAPSAEPVAVSAVRGGSGGMGVALGMAGGLLVLLAAGVWLVNRRWPLPGSARRGKGE